MRRVRWKWTVKRGPTQTRSSLMITRNMSCLLTDRTSGTARRSRRREPHPGLLQEGVIGQLPQGHGLAAFALPVFEVTAEIMEPEDEAGFQVHEAGARRAAERETVVVQGDLVAHELEDIP